MKIELEYREPGTKIAAYIFHVFYDESEFREAREERDAAERMGYEITIWRLIHDEDAVY